MKTKIAYLIEAAAIALLSFGVWSIYEPLGYVVGAAGLFAYAQGIK